MGERGPAEGHLGGSGPAEGGSGTVLREEVARPREEVAVALPKSKLPNLNSPI